MSEGTVRVPYCEECDAAHDEAHHAALMKRRAEVERAVALRKSRERTAETARLLLIYHPSPLSVDRALRIAEEFEFLAAEYVRKG